MGGWRKGDGFRFWKKSIYLGKLMYRAAEAIEMAVAWFFKIFGEQAKVQWQIS